MNDFVHNEKTDSSYYVSFDAKELVREVDAEIVSKRLEYKCSTMTTVLREFVMNHKMLVLYFNNLFGYRKGIIVALSENQIGWSCVHKEDRVYRQMSPEQIPVIKQMIRCGVAAKDIFQSEPFKKYLRYYCKAEVPTFSRDEGLLIAIDRAVYCQKIVIENHKVVEPKLPHMKELHRAFILMTQKAKKFFKNPETISNHIDERREE
jgi:hypothetical protein